MSTLNDQYQIIIERLHERGDAVIDHLEEARGAIQNIDRSQLSGENARHFRALKTPLRVALARMEKMMQEVRTTSERGPQVLFKNPPEDVE